MQFKKGDLVFYRHPVLNKQIGIVLRDSEDSLTRIHFPNIFRPKTRYVLNVSLKRVSK